MSIISEALKKVSDQRQASVRVRDEELGRIFVSDAKRVDIKRARWSMVSGAGVVLILALAVFLFMRYAGSVAPAMYSGTPALKSAPGAAVKASPEGMRAVADGPVETEALGLFTLNGVMEGGGESLAMINNTILRKGEFYRGGQIVGISQDSVKLLYKDKEVTLRIK